MYSIAIERSDHKWILTLYGGLAQGTEFPIYIGDLWNSLLPNIKDVKSWQHSKERIWQKQILETCFSLWTGGERGVSSRRMRRRLREDRDQESAQLTNKHMGLDDLLSSPWEFAAARGERHGQLCRLGPILLLLQLLSTRLGKG